MIKAKRFWREVTLDKGRIYLDARALTTPAKREMVIPYPALGELVVAEWRAVEGEIDPKTMVFTRMVNSAIDHIPPKRAEIISQLLPYLQTDLLIFRASAPEALVAMQAQWDPWLEWAYTHGLRLQATQTLVAPPLAEDDNAAARAWLQRLDDFGLVGAYDAITLLGSFVLGMAVVEGALDASDAFDLSIIEERYQISQWGDDALAAEQRDARAEAMAATGRFLASVDVASITTSR